MELNKELKVNAQKAFSVSLDDLYHTWTDPNELKQWWKPMGNTLKEVTNDVKKGGKVRYEFNDNKLIISGEYLEVQEKQKLVYTWNWELPADAVENASYQLTVNFIGKDGGSELHILQENFENEESMLPHQEGWEKGLSDLEQYLNQSSESTGPDNNENKIPNKGEAGYREDPAQVKVGGG